MSIMLKGGTVIDGTDGRARKNTDVVIDNGKISALGEAAGATAVDTVIDVTGKTVMPGIIDSHVHFYSPYCHFRVYHQDVRHGFIDSKTLWGMERMLKTGVTAGRDLGGLDAGFVDAEEAGLINAPRLAGNAVQFITPTNGSIDQMSGWGGYVSLLGQSLKTPGVPHPHADGPWEVRKKIREVLLAGGEVIKFGSGGCLAQRQYHHSRPTFTPEEIAVFVDEGRRQNLKVHCHVIGGQGLHDAIVGGVDCIEHGNLMDDKLIDEMANRGTWWVPTFWIIDLHAKMDPTEKDRDYMKRAYEMTANNLNKAKSAGVKISMGSDGGTHDPDGLASMIELAMMVDAGMSASDVLVCATRNAAELIGIDDKVGTLESGKEADLLVVDGDPLKDISVLQEADRLNLVLKAGAPVAGTWTEPGFPAIAARANNAQA